MRFFLILFFSLALTGCGNQIKSLSWVSMGTIARVQWRGENDALAHKATDEIKKVFSEIEKKLNAHKTESEISLLAKIDDEDEIISRASKETRPCYEAAFLFKKLTDGAFNPRWKGEGTLDFGGIAKGFALDCAARAIQSFTNEDDFPDFMIDLGGSLYSVKGIWKVALLGMNESFLLQEGECCATSAEYFRGKHIYDARIKKPAESNVKAVTIVTTRDATRADALSTIFFIFGSDAARAWHEKNSLPTDRVFFSLK